MTFQDPWFLLLLLGMPLLWLYRARRGRRSTVGYSGVAAFASLPRSWTVRLHRVLPVLRYLAVIGAVVALARPQWGVEATEITTEGIAISMVVDISSSMGALDLQLDDVQSNRLEVVKRTFKDFVAGDDGDLPGRQDDLIAISTFARYADTLSPLTLDHDALLEMVDEIVIVPLPEDDGTAIGDAIAIGVDSLRRADAASRVMILLTDGSNNAGEADPVDGARIAKAMGIKIYTIGAGSQGNALIPIREGSGTRLASTQVFIDEFTLGRVAEVTGGQYFRATDETALREIYAEIDRLEKSTNVAAHFQKYIEGFPLVLALVLGALLVDMGLTQTRLRSVP